MLVAMIALVVACAGTATAASVLIHSSSQIGNGVITGRNIHAGTITGKHIQSGAIGANQIANSSIGTSKLTGSVLKALGKSSGGSTSTSAIGSAIEWDRQSGPSNVAAGQPSQRLITASNVPAGVYAIFGEANISDINAPGSLLQMLPTASAQCSITADADVAYGSTVIGGAYFAGSGQVSMMVTHTFAGPGTITMDCASPAAAWQAAGSTIIAIRLSSAPKNAVTS